MERTKRTVECTEQDNKFVEVLVEESYKLCKMVEEMVKLNPSYLLSPIMRELLVEKAALVERNLFKVRNLLLVDNLYKPLEFK
jgi:hypothetical protein